MRAIPACRGQINQIRIDHNTFTLGLGAATVAVHFSVTQSSNGYYYGVMDHNNVTAANAESPSFFGSGLSIPHHRALHRGTATICSLRTILST